jgi:hypothetical protein
MTRLRIIIFTTTIIVVSTVGYFASLFARGYRFNPKTGDIAPSGILVANSDPNGAQILIDGELKGATNTTINLPPGTYDISIRRDGFIDWNKRIQIITEEVTQIDVSLFRGAPSLSAITFAGAINPTISPDNTKVLYAVPPNGATDPSLDKSGLWMLETVNLPLGFNREPRRITDGDMTTASWIFSPDSRQVLVTTLAGTFLLNANEMTPQKERVNVASQKQTILAKWDEEKVTRRNAMLTNLPIELQDFFKLRTKDIALSPDETKILYTATMKATIQEGLLPLLPGSSTQKQNREVKQDHKYVFDIKEDRNFEVADAKQIVYWFPNSLNLVMPEENKISILDYDATNKQTIFVGNYVLPVAFPSTSTDRLLILTNFGAADSYPNLYSLGVK